MAYLFGAELALVVPIRHHQTNMQTKTIDLNGEFHRVYEIKELSRLGIPDAQTIFVRIQLIGGELSELAAALAAQDPIAVFDALVDSQYVVDGTYRTFGMPESKREFSLVDKPVLGMTNLENNLNLLAGLNREHARFIKHVADGQVDLLPSCLNRVQNELDLAWRSLGFGSLRFAGYTEVHRSNMSKLGEDGRPIKFPSGKVGKGPNFFEPNLAQLMTTRPEGLPDEDWTLWRKAMHERGIAYSQLQGLTYSK